MSVADSFMAGFDSFPMEIDSDISASRDEIGFALSENKAFLEVAAIERWLVHNSPDGSRRSTDSLFNRDRYLMPATVYDQFKLASSALENDDTVSNALETTESFAFDKLKFNADNDDEKAAWNALGTEWGLADRMREMWGELFKYSQVVVGMYWSENDIKLPGKTTNGTKRKKVFKNVKYPTDITMLDPLKIVPVGSFMFGREKLLYVPSREEAGLIDGVLDGKIEDPLVRQLMLSEYTPNVIEWEQIGQSGFVPASTTMLNAKFYLLNPNNVWRFTLTRPSYQKFANVRIKSIFPLLDLKENLRRRDRVHIVAATNFIVLIKKGSAALPADNKEIKALRAQAQTLAKMPLLVGDDRLSVEIITPPNDNTLKSESYELINSQISANLYHMFLGSGRVGTTKDDSISLARIVSKGIEGRRSKMAKAFMDHVVQKIIDSNPSLFTDEMPELIFQPEKVSLEFDSATAMLLVQLFQQNAVSRETILNYFDLDQDREAKRVLKEEQEYDAIFKPINPYNQQDPKLGQSQGGNSDPTVIDTTTPGRAKGGVNNGGGAAPGTGQGQSTGS